MKLLRISLVMLALVVLLFACRHEFLFPGGTGSGGGNNTPPPASSTCSPDTVYFVNEIQPIISSNCTMSGCHDAVTHANGVNLTTYTNIRRYVTPGNAADSKIWEVINKTGSDRMPPAPMLPLTAEQKAKIQKWINQGAKNNYCTGGCDTAVFTYSGAIKGIMTNHCIGCHNPSSLGGNIDLSVWSGVNAVALNGKLYGSVTHQAGYSAMPKNATKLTDCQITQIDKWIKAGAPNN